MTPTTNHPNFTLKKGIKYTICNPSVKCDGTETFGETQDNYIVDLVVQYDPDGKPDSATAYMPNQAACLSRGLPNTPECQLDLLFQDEQLVQLISSSPQTFKDPPKVTGNVKPPQLVGVEGNQPPPPTPQPNTAADLVLPALLAGLVGGAAFSVIQAIVTLFLKRKRTQNTSRVLKNSATRDIEKHSELAESDRIAREVQKQLFPARQKTQELEKRVFDLEIKLIEQYQKDQALGIKSPSIGSVPPDISFTTKEPAIYLPPPPPPALSIDIIKQAVLDWSYQSIASYQFDFVTETIQSQKGEVDIKSFSIDGNQDQSDSRSTSEFIAISCQEVTYLIPNILQNAGDPALTISRHLKRIYKKGIGSELKNLAKPAIVRKTGDCYELVEMGQVA
jgi:hypothetical protein